MKRIFGAIKTAFFLFIIAYGLSAQVNTGGGVNIPGVAPTYSTITSVPTNTVLGRTAAGTGNAEALTTIKLPNNSFSAGPAATGIDQYGSSIAAGITIYKEFTTTTPSAYGASFASIFNPPSDPPNAWFGLNQGIYVTNATSANFTHGLYGANYTITFEGTGNVNYSYGLYGATYWGGSGNATKLYGVYGGIQNYGTGTVASATAVYADEPYNYGGGVITVAYGYWASTQRDAVNGYFNWYDTDGVGRCKDDNKFNSVYQSICVVYNPQFTKYTPGAADYERVVYGQFNSNVAEIGTEAGGTGTLRDVRLLGAHLLVNGLKTTGAATGKTVVCVDVATGQLYASTSGVACLN